MQAYTPVDPIWNAPQRWSFIPLGVAKSSLKVDLWICQTIPKPPRISTVRRKIGAEDLVTHFCQLTF
jgi:hypothetical protein